MWNCWIYIQRKKPELIKNFIGDLHHRGPDNIGIKIIKINDNYLHLGSSRLAIREMKKKTCLCRQLKVIN